MSLFDRAMAMIAPHSCLICGDEGSLLCGWCAPEQLQLVPSRCYLCVRQTEDFATCNDCRSKTPLKHVWVRAEYDEVFKRLIHKLKFERAMAAAQTVASLIEERLPYLGSELIVTHLPTATGRRRQRGYDQSELIAKYLSAKRNLKHLALLSRLGKSRQVGASRASRLKQMEGAFFVRKANGLKGKTVLLIDDVLTTGASLESAARTLRKAGAKQVFAATFAHRR